MLSAGGAACALSQMVEFAGYELPVQYEGEHGGVLKGKRCAAAALDDRLVAWRLT